MGGDFEAAIYQFEQVLIVDGDLVVALNNLALLYLRRRDARATEMAQKAYRLTPSNPAIMDTLGWVLAAGGHFERARELLEAAVKKAPGMAEIRYHLAWVLAQQGNIGRARELLDDLLQDGAKSELKVRVEALLQRLQTGA